MVSLVYKGAQHQTNIQIKMSSTTQKHRRFVAEPIRNKPVTDLAGVGDVLGKRLASSGYSKADNVMGQYLVVNRDKERFQGWMKETCQANTKQSSDCYQCLDDWNKNFL